MEPERASKRGRQRGRVSACSSGVTPFRFLPEFSRALAELGWIDGKTVHVEVESAGGRHDQICIRDGW
jgi:hypothetical protein